MSTSPTLMRLDLETRPHHAAADAAWRDLLVEDVTEAAYAAQLARVYGFEGPLEAALAYTPGLARVIDLRRRQRAGLLAQDLLALDLEPAQIANLPGLALAPFASVPEALGWMYVVERATNVHRFVREHLIAHLPRPDRSTAYLSAYETSIGSRWLELAAALDRFAGDARTTDQIIVAAFEGFRCAIDWYERRGTARLQRVG